MRQALESIRAWWSIVVAGVAVVAACVGGGGGEAARNAPGVSGDTISVGSLSPLSDAVAVLGKPITNGLQAYIERLNAAGGVAGRYHVRLLIEDVTYANPSTSVQKYQKLRGDVAMFAQILGTDHINTLLPLLAEDSLMAVPTTFDAEWVREPNLVPWGPHYQIAAINGIAYYRGLPGNEHKRICGLAIATGYGDAGLEGLNFAARDMGFEVRALARFKQDDQDFVAPIARLRSARCDAVFLASLPGTTGRLLGAAAQLNFRPQWISLTPSWHASLAASPLLPYFEANLLLSWDGPNWGDTTVTGMRDMMAALGRYVPDQKPDLYASAGWILGYLTHRALEVAAAANDLSRSGIMRAADQLGTRDFDGLMSPYRYGPAAEREPARANEIFRISGANPMTMERAGHRVESPTARKFVFERRVR